ncbi:MAG: allene oxide cyclase barrel-like domain-containing protein [Streptosporangiaceae bacterium]
MGKRLGALGAVIAVVALAVGIALPAAGSTGNAAQDKTIRVTVVTTEQKLLDLGGPGFSLGNEIVFSQKLLQGAKQVGHDGSVCTEVSVARQEAQCIATYSFPGGQITGQALVILGSKAPYVGSITGGTGKYEGAKGELHVQNVSPTEGILTFHLEH